VLTRHLGDVDAAAAEAIARRVLEQFESDPPDPASFPSMASQVIDLIESPEVDIHELIRVVGQDPAISAKILKVANSAWYRRPTEIEELRPAVLLLGLKEVANLAIGVAGRALFDVEARAEFALFAERWHRLYLDAMANAFAASWLCGELAVGRPDRAFLGGMFHDIGKTVALRTLSTLMIRGRLQSRVPDAVVDRVLEDVHIDLGVSLLAAWQLPEYLTNICLRHHDPRVPEVPDYADLHVVRVVSTLSLLRGGEADANLPLDPLQQSLSALRMTREQTRKLYAHMLELTARLESTLGVGR
jgi:HD-like signal output (HDOD) protein